MFKGDSFSADVESQTYSLLSSHKIEHGTHSVHHFLNIKVFSVHFGSVSPLNLHITSVHSSMEQVYISFHKLFKKLTR